jgi:hypothetical protein
MKPEEKIDTLFSKVYLPTFIEKMAEAGLPITNENDLHEALKTAALIRSQVGSVEEQAPQVNPLLKTASAELEKALTGDAKAAQGFLGDPAVKEALS